MVGSIDPQKLQGGTNIGTRLGGQQAISTVQGDGIESFGDKISWPSWTLGDHFPMNQNNTGLQDKSSSSSSTRIRLFVWKVRGIESLGFLNFEYSQIAY